MGNTEYTISFSRYLSVPNPKKKKKKKGICLFKPYRSFENGIHLDTVLIRDDM